MFLVNVFEFMLGFEPMLYIFGAFAFFGVMLLLNKIIRG